jgi:hypothetical protein
MLPIQLQILKLPVREELLLSQEQKHYIKAMEA